MQAVLILFVQVLRYPSLKLLVSLGLSPLRMVCLGPCYRAWGPQSRKLLTVEPQCFHEKTCDLRKRKRNTAECFC